VQLILKKLLLVSKMRNVDQASLPHTQNDFSRPERVNQIPENLEGFFVRPVPGHPRKLFLPHEDQFMHAKLIQL